MTGVYVFLCGYASVSGRFHTSGKIERHRQSVFYLKLGNLVKCVPARSEINAGERSPRVSRASRGRCV